MSALEIGLIIVMGLAVLLVIVIGQAAFHTMGYIDPEDWH